MRITIDDSPGGEITKSNSFAEFAYSEEDSRQPNKQFMKDIRKLPVSKQKGTKRIVVSDEDEDDDDGWLDSRDVKQLSEKEREKNKKIAVAQRKAAAIPVKASSSSSSSQIKKAQRMKYDDDESEVEILDSPERKVNLKKVLSKSTLIANSLLNRDHDFDGSEMDPVEQVRRFKKLEKLNNRAKRAADRGTKPKAKRSAGGAIDLCSSEEEADDDDDSTDEDGEEMNWRDDIGQVELKEQAHKVLRHCDLVSVNLRKSLKEWSTGDLDGASSSNDKDCVDLVAIDDHKDSGQLLHESDITVLCPDLTLKAYQLVGVNWMKLLHENNVNGVLADDMGLGKTVQTIAFLAWLKTHNDTKKVKPHFIVVPASTLANWQNELRRFCPSFHVVTYHGSQNERANLRQELRSEIQDGTVDIILSTYTIFERESGKVDRGFLYNQSFDYMILDEAHCIKNSESSRFVNLNQLKTKHRLLLSGTPVQNDLGELLAMLSFLMPSVFGKDKCELLMDAFGFVKGSTTSSNGNVTLNQLRGMLVPFVLRRLKRDVLDQLTDKTNVLEKLDMTEFQRRVYDSVLIGHTVRRDRLKAAFAEKEEALNAIEIKSVKKSASSASVAVSTAASTDGKKTKKLSKLSKELIDLTNSPLPSKAPTKKSCDNLSEMGGSVVDVMSVAGTVADEVTSTVDLDVLGKEELKATVLTEDSVNEMVGEMSASEANHLFTALRKAANHPLLLRVRYKDEAVMERIATIAYHHEHFGNQCDYARVRAELDKYSDFDLHLICMEYPDTLGGYELEASVLYDSPKMKKLREMLPKLQAEGHRMLIFSQWTRLLDLLGVFMYDMNMPFLRLDGSTPIKERQELIDTYNVDTSIPVFLLSTKAGGLGINLTAADTVIMHDLDFNPENDRQAEDRCHRIGQTRPVTVYKLVTEGTVDELIYEMGERKRQLSQAVLSDERQGKGVKSPSGKSAATSTAEGEGDVNAISKMLQRALAQRTSVAVTVSPIENVEESI